MGTVTPGADGTLGIPVRPTATTYYRLTSGKISAASARVRVAPLVRLVLPQTPSELRGSMRPAIAGAAVFIQRQVGTKWPTVARTTVDSAGAFDVQLQLTSGTYRARIVPGHGLAVGFSAVLQVTTS